MRESPRSTPEKKLDCPPVLAPVRDQLVADLKFAEEDFRVSFTDTEHLYKAEHEAERTKLKTYFQGKVDKATSALKSFDQGDYQSVLETLGREQEELQSALNEPMPPSHMGIDYPDTSEEEARDYVANKHKERQKTVDLLTGYIEKQTNQG